MFGLRIRQCFDLFKYVNTLIYLESKFDKLYTDESSEVVQLRKWVRGKRIYFKKAPVYSSSVQRFGQPTAVAVRGKQSYNRQLETAPGGGV